MSFSRSSRAVRLDGTVLHAECRNYSSRWLESLFYLSAVLGNQDGEFKWLGKDYHLSARNVTLDGSVLHAELKTRDAQWKASSIDLDERIRNLDGELTYHESGDIYSRLGQSLTATGVFQYNSRDYGSFGAPSRRVTEFVQDAESVRTTTATTFSDLPRYQYSRLSTPKSIRLVKIEPTGPDAKLIYCSLAEFSLDAAPPFAALSYTWGNPFPSERLDAHYAKPASINCNGQSMEITQNLFEALGRLRTTTYEEPRGRYSKTPLIEKAEQGSILDVERLLREGADVHARDQFNETALHYAAENGHIMVVKALVYAGSDLGARDNLDRTPLDCTRWRRRRFWVLVEAFLEQHGDANIHRRANSCLRNHVSEHEFFWIDALCVDQHHKDEKAQQVQLMGDIYKTASTVVVWLGPTYDSWQDPTLKLLRGLWMLEGARSIGKIQDDAAERMLQIFDRGNPYEVQTSAADQMVSAVKDWIATFDENGFFDGWLLGPPLFRRTWFERAWILQEVIMARHITVACGNFLVPWDILSFVSTFVHGMHSSVRFRKPHQKRIIGAILTAESSQRTSPIELGRRRAFYHNHGKVSMLNAISLTRNASATDMRDKVFSALSWASLSVPSPQGTKQIVPDYTQTTTTLYTSVAKSLLKSYGPSVLSLAGMHEDRVHLGLPSWVPDLQMPMYTWPRGIDPDDSGVSTNNGPDHLSPTATTVGTSLLRITKDDTILFDGCIYAKIDEVCLPGLSDVGDSLQILEAWIKIVQSTGHAGDAAMLALHRTLMEFETSSTRSAPCDFEQTCRDFHSWLMFRCFTSIFQLTSYVRGCVETFSVPWIKSAAQPALAADDRKRVPRLLNKAARLFQEMGMHFELNSPEVPAQARELFQEATSGVTLSETSEAWQIWEHLAPFAESYGNRVKSRDATRCLVRMSHCEQEQSKILLGTAPKFAEPGDLVVAVNGARVMYVLRRFQHTAEADDADFVVISEQGHEEKRFILVGEAFVDGVDVELVLRESAGNGTQETICLV